MKDNKKETKDIMQFILQSFVDYPKSVRVVIASIAILIFILQFFAATNLIEAVVSIMCFAILIFLSYLKGKVWGILRGFWAIGILLNYAMTIFVGAPFGGVLSNESIEHYKEKKFHVEFAHALHKMSADEFDEALDIFEQVEFYVPEEYAFEYYLWYSQTAMYAGKEEDSVELLSKVEKSVNEYNQEQKNVVFKYLPICKMINYLNIEDFDGLRDVALQYQNTNEQIFVLFELVSLCLVDDISQNQDRLEELIVSYWSLSDNFQKFSGIKYELLSLVATCLMEEYPEYATILFAELFDENKAFFHEAFLYVYDGEYNLTNMRWISVTALQMVRECCEKGWEIIQEKDDLVLNQYIPKIEQLGLYLGIEKFVLEKVNAKEIDDNKYEEFELCNVLPVNRDCFLGIYLEKMDTGFMGEYGIAASAHFCLLRLEGNVLVSSPLMIQGQELISDVLMNKLFLVEETKEEGLFLVEAIVGTGEFLQLEVLDLNDYTYETIEGVEEIYHTSEYMFNGADAFTANFEIENEIDSNMARKVGGRISATIDYKNNTISKIIEYCDPAIEFYDSKRNDELVFPLVNLDVLNGKEIKSRVLLEKIRENSIPYYQYSLIQQSYEYFFEVAGCKLSGVTIVYDVGTDREASFFYYVEKEADDVKLMGIYEIVDGELQSVY